MSKAQCPKCDNESFEAVIQTIENINNTMSVVRCKSCYAAIGVIDISSADRIRKMEDALKRLGGRGLNLG